MQLRKLSGLPKEQILKQTSLPCLHRNPVCAAQLFYGKFSGRREVCSLWISSGTLERRRRLRVHLANHRRFDSWHAFARSRRPKQLLNPNSTFDRFSVSPRKEVKNRGHLRVHPGPTTRALRKGAPRRNVERRPNSFGHILLARGYVPVGSDLRSVRKARMAPPLLIDAGNAESMTFPAAS